MYLPHHFTESRPEVLGAFMRAHPFATLVSLGGDGLIGTHLPMLWDPAPAPFGTLTGHIARPNPQAKGAKGGVDALAIFHGPQAYISPNWYPSKREHGKVVPTWNYIAVHAYGPLKLVDDAEWLRRLVTRLTDLHESFSAVPWKVTDAPDDYVEKMLSAIIGIEIPVTRLLGKWKASQNRTNIDRERVVQGLKERDAAGDRTMSEWVRATLDSRGQPRE